MQLRGGQFWAGFLLRHSAVLRGPVASDGQRRARVTGGTRAETGTTTKIPLVERLFLRKLRASTGHFRPRTHREGNHFHFSQQIFILSREGLASGSADDYFLPGETSSMPRYGLATRHSLLSHS